MRRAAFLAGAFLLFSAAAHASPFADGNRLYQTGDFKAAAAAYEEALKAGDDTAAVHYNLAGSYFRLGQKGKAMVEYLRAFRLAPRDADVRWNLEILKSVVPDRLEPSGAAALLARVTDLYTRDEAAAALGAAAFLFALVSFLGWTFPAFGERDRALKVVALLLVAVSVAALALKWQEDHAPLVVVLRRETPARYGPSLKETAAFTLHEGAALRVQDRTKDWVYVALPNGNGGWIELAAAETV